MDHLLLENGAHPNVGAICGRDALELAVDNKFPLDVIKLLVVMAQKSKVEDSYHLRQSIEVVDFLLEDGAPLDAKIRGSFSGARLDWCFPLRIRHHNSLKPKVRGWAMKASPRFKLMF
jgi:hypothetical protein